MEAHLIEGLFGFNKITFNDDGTVFIHEAFFRYRGIDIVRSIKLRSYANEMKPKLMAAVFREALLPELLDAIKIDGEVL